MHAVAQNVAVFNCYSIKSAVYTIDPNQARLQQGQLEHLGQPNALFTVQDDGRPPESTELPAVDLQSVAGTLATTIGRRLNGLAVSAVSHRIVHGGTRFREPVIAPPQILNELRSVAPLSPTYLPNELSLIEAFAER